MLPFISWFALMPLNFINVRHVFGLFVENEHKIQYKTQLQDCWNYFCRLHNLEIFQNFFCKMYHLENLADQMKIITSVVDGWTRWFWKLALKPNLRAISSCQPKFQLLPGCVSCFQRWTLTVHTKVDHFFHFVLFFFLKWPYCFNIRDWNFF